VTRKQITDQFREATTRRVLDAIAKSEAETIAWAKQLIAVTPEGGVIDLGFTLKYRVCHTQKMLILKNPEELCDDGLRVLHHELVAKFNKIGWQVSEGTM